MRVPSSLTLPEMQRAFRELQSLVLEDKERSSSGAARNAHSSLAGIGAPEAQSPGNSTKLQSEIDRIIRLFEDGILTEKEKAELRLRWAQAQADFVNDVGTYRDAGLAQLVGINADSYIAAYDVLDSISYIWMDPGESKIGSLDPYKTWAIFLAEKADFTARAASAVATLSNDLKARMDASESDNILTETEKPLYRMTWEQIEQRHPGLMFDGSRLGPNAVVAPWSEAYDALYAIRNVWSETGQTDISAVNPKPSVRFNTYFAAEQALEDAIGDGIRVGIDSALTPSCVADGTTAQFLVGVPAKRTNWALYSGQFDHASWGKTRSSIAASAVIGPLGTAAFRWTEDSSASATHHVGRGIFGLPAGSDCIVYFDAKIGERDLAIFTSDKAAVAVGSYFNLTTGAVTSKAHADAGVIDMGGGWKRCWVRTNTGTGVAEFYAYTYGALAGTSTRIYTGDGTSGFWISEAQVELGTAPTDYIPSGATAVSDYGITCEDWRGAWELSPSPRTNLITYSNTFTGATWYRSNYPTVTTGIVSPTGASNATKLTAGSTAPYLQQTSPSMPLGFITASIWIKGVGASIGKAGMLWLWEAGTGRAAVQNTKTIFTIPAEWTRISVTANVTTAGTFLFRLDAPDHVATIGDEVCIFNAQLEVGSVATPDIITPGASAVTVTDITVSNGLATLSPAPLQGAILRGVSSNASQQASLAAPAIVTDHAAISLPHASYPAGRIVYQTGGTPAGTLWQVNAAGTGWQTPSVGVAQIVGQLIAGQIAAGAINVSHLAAVLAIVGEIKSGGTGAVYNGTSSVMSTLGFKIAGTPFTAMGADGATQQVSADFSGPVMIAGRKAATLVSKVMGGKAVLTTGTSWTVPDGITKLTITICGGGAGGNGGNAGNSGNPSVAAQGGFAGGGGGVIKFQVDVAPADTITYFIGAKGTGGQGGQTSGAFGAGGTSGGATSITVNGITATANGGSITAGGSVVGAYNGVTITSGQTYQMSNGFLIAGGSGGGLTAPSTGADSKAGGANGTGTGYGRGSGASALSNGKVGANGPPAPNNSDGYAAVSAGATEYGAGGAGGGGGRGFLDISGRGGNGGDGGPGVIIIEY